MEAKSILIGGAAKRENQRVCDEKLFFRSDYENSRPYQLLVCMQKPVYQIAEKKKRFSCDFL